MTPERWQTVKETLHEAMQRDPSQRPAYLDGACAGDPALRQEVESLLRADENARSGFLKSHPSERVALSKGDQLGPYVIVASLGAGGMGEVYLAHDPRLSRDVAIKILPRTLSRDDDRLHRFAQEARAAAALSHPAILAVFDVSVGHQPTPYIVTELLEGETLRERLNRGRLPPRKVVEYALQIALGLAAAHAKGIVHRDLKPENLFVTTEDRIKILDFGLAKLTTREAEPQATTLGFETEAGAVVGTLGYMSPEQVSGEHIDHRSDIFSLGAVLYEMAWGEHAFRGKTRAATVSAILNSDPPDLSGRVSGISPGLNRLVHRCLEKKPDQRFHSARDLAFALEAISDTTVREAAAVSGGMAAQSATTRGRRYWGAAIAIALGITAGFWYYRAKKPAPKPTEWVQLTNFPDSVTSPALSPDGRLLAFLRNANTFDAGELYLKLLPGGEPFQLTHDATVKLSPTFTPDGSRIAYTLGGVWDTWVVPVLGGEPHLLLPRAAGLTWIDDQHILFSEPKGGVHMGVATANESRAEERSVYIPADDTGMAHNSYLAPDRSHVLVVEMGPVKGYGWMPCRLVPFDGSSPGHAVGPADAQCIGAGWSIDGKWMFFNSNTGGAFHIWRQRFPDGTPEQLTSGPTSEEGIAISPDGQSLVTSVGVESSSILIHDKLGERQIAFEGFATFPNAQTAMRTVFSPNGGKLYFLGQLTSTRPLELWVADVSSGRSEKVLPGTTIANSYDISPDGKQVVFDSANSQGKSRLWIAALDHRVSPRRFESDAEEDHGLFGRAGEVYFEAKEGGKTYLYSRSVDGKDRRKVLSEPIVRLATISPNGRWVVTEVPVHDEEGTRGVVAYDLRDGSAKRICRNLCFVMWTGDGKFLCISVFGKGDKDQSLPTRKTFLIPLRGGHDFPPLPSAGIESEADLVRLPGVQAVNELVRPGANVSTYAFARFAVHRNLYRIPISNPIASGILAPRE